LTWFGRVGECVDSRFKRHFAFTESHPQMSRPSRNVRFSAASRNIRFRRPGVAQKLGRWRRFVARSSRAATTCASRPRCSRWAGSDR
jgi:hypothetical protein